MQSEAQQGTTGRTATTKNQPGPHTELRISQTGAILHRTWQLERRQIRWGRAGGLVSIRRMSYHQS
ncbi:MAG: hypothetical protein CMJ70_24675 [Planctomycetaceae bacterium]|nr:hypothetical protein [Planctomycetaceae bacterium]HAA72174.1 hypothetical protein [Planctomycetaceae bacterium]